MRLSVSNIAWDKLYDEDMYVFLSQNEFEGLEIAPTRIWVENPYDQLSGAREFSKKIKNEYGLIISSMQSIWYGKPERIFGEEKERISLIEYTKKAFEFANVLGCRNLVFGCPKNRLIPEGMEQKTINLITDDFFGRLAELAAQNNTVLAIEANPTIYNTNYINYTSEAYELIKRIDNKGFGLNYDFGTVIYNKESVTDIKEYMSVTNHVHISEPKLAEIKFSHLHYMLKSVLQQEGYDKFVSIEMGNCNDVEIVKKVCADLKELFAE